MKALKLFFVPIFMLTLFSNAAFAATIYVSPASIVNQSLTPGSNFTVNIKIDNAVSLYGFDFKVYWNNSLLDFVSATSSSNNIWLNSLKWLDKNYSNYYNAAYSAMIPANGFTGSTTLVTIKFRVKGIGTSSLEIKDVKLGNSLAFPITYTVSSGLFNNQPVCTCGSWIKKSCTSDGSCTTCLYTRTCTPSGCSQTTKTTRACS
jgi:hypothetical protein